MALFASLAYNHDHDQIDCLDDTMMMMPMRMRRHNEQVVAGQRNATSVSHLYFVRMDDSDNWMHAMMMAQCGENKRLSSMLVEVVRLRVEQCLNDLMMNSAMDRLRCNCCCCWDKCVSFVCLFVC